MAQMKKTLLTIVAILLVLAASAQKDGSNSPFRAYLFNNEYEVYLQINFYDKNIHIPGQDLYGELPGYLGKLRNSFCWVMVSADIQDDNKAVMTLINDFGSDDLTASLTRKNDSIYVLRQESGSTIKIPWKGKWRKLPKTLEFKRRR